MRIFFSAGEASGDTYAAALTKAFRAENPSAVYEGLAGRKAHEAGVKLIRDSSDWGVIGVVQALKQAPKIARGVKAIKRAMAEGAPGLFIPIDYGYVNIRLIKHAKALGWKVLYFIPPGSWRKDRQGADLPAWTDAIVTPFPWSAEILTRMGANAFFFGHPLAELIDEVPEAKERWGLAVLPGSRHHEIGPHLEVLAKALRDWTEPIVFGVAQTMTLKEMEEMWARAGGQKAVFRHDVHRVLKECRTGVICSGTATLEAALCGLPMILIYRGTALMRAEFKLRRPKFFAIGLPNIIAEKMIVPELIADGVTSQAILQHLIALDADSGLRQTQLSEFKKLQDDLSGSHVIEETVRVAKSLLEGPRQD